MISFVLPAYNEEALIGHTLDAIRRAAEAASIDYEIIVVDDASTDGTARIARSRGVRVVPVGHRQISAVRNAGARAARGSMLIFVDADTILPEATLRAALKAMDDGVIGGGGVVQFDGRIPLYARLVMPLHKHVAPPLKLLAGCFIFCTREAFDATGGFDESLFACEELVMANALKRQGRFVVLREHVITSGRKLRQYSAIEILSLLGRLALFGPRAFRRRDGLEIWYAGPREQSPPPPRSGPEEVT